MRELFLNKMLQKLLKYLNRWRSYGENKSGLFFFWDTVYKLHLFKQSIFPVNQSINLDLYNGLSSKDHHKTPRRSLVNVQKISRK